MPLELGLTHETYHTVLPNDTAGSNRPGLPEVFSTPNLVAFLEWTAHLALVPELESGQTSVGAVVNVEHLAATPVGMQVRFRAELIEIDRRRLKFRVEAWDEQDKIAQGEHIRVIIDLQRFNQQVEEKRSKILGA